MPRLPKRTIPPSWVSIDPGDLYVGWADWEGAQCVRTAELNPRECIERLEARTGWPYSGVRLIDAVVCERWMLYPWKRGDFNWNEFLTSQLIGKIKYVCERSGTEYIAYTAQEGKMTYNKEPWVNYTAKDWQALLGGPVGRGHTKDAVAHGLNHLWELGWRP